MEQAAGHVTGLLLPLVYAELRRLAHREMRRERPGHRIGTTALVHEAYLRLADQSRARVESRIHFLNLSAQMEQAAEVLGTSTTSAWRDRNTARAWLYDALSAS